MGIHEKSGSRLVCRQIEFVCSAGIVGAEDTGPFHVGRLRIWSLSCRRFVVRQTDRHVPIRTAQAEHKHSY